MEVEPAPPYRARLYCPGEVTKLLSYEEAWKMLWDRQYELMAQRNRICF